MYGKIIALTATAVVSTATALGKKIYDNKHYDKDGYNAKGYDKEGYSRYGYDKNGYNKDGYNKEGYNKYGYDISGYEKNGYDIHLNKRSYYRQKVIEMRSCLDKAYRQMARTHFNSAMQYIGTEMETALKCILFHWSGNHTADEINSNTLESNISLCEKNYIFNDEFTEKLNALKKSICNNSGSIEYNQVNSCYRTFDELIFCIEKFS